MGDQMRNDEFWDDLASIVDGDQEAVEKHADLLAESDEHRDARHEAEAAANAVADSGMDFELPADMDARVLAAVDAGGAAAQAPQGGGDPTPAQPEEHRATVPDQPPAMEPAKATGNGASAGTAPDKKGGGKVILLFGFAAAAAALLVVAGLGTWAVLSGDEEETGPVVAAVGTLGARLATVQRAADDQEAGVDVRAGESGAFAPIRVGADIAAGATIRTDERTRARIELSDGSTVVLNQGTELVLDGISPRTVRLSSGELVAEIARLEQGPHAIFATPTGRIEVLGTKFVLTATEELATVRVTRGAVRAQSATGAGMEVKAGEEGLMPKAGTASVAPAVNLARSVSWSELGGSEEDTERAIRGIGSLRARRPGEREDRERPLTVALHKATVRVVGNVARTEIEETFQNDSNAVLEGIYRFPMPADARIATLALEVDGQWEQGAFVERDRAARIWRGVIRNATPERQREQREEFIWVPGPWRDPALLEWQRGGNFELRIFPIPANGSRRIRIAYTQNIAPNGAGGRRYVHPLPHSDDESTRVGRFEVDLRVAGNDGDVTARGYEMASAREGNGTTLRYAADNFLPKGDLMVDYHLENEDSEIRWWTFQGEATAAAPERTREGSDEVLRIHRELHGDQRGYAVFALRPELPAWTEGRSRDYVLVIDASQSMVGERYERATRLAAGIVGEMDRRDRFLVLACDATCQQMGDSPEAPSAQAAARVTTWLGSVQPAGASDVGAALRRSVAALEGKRNPDRDVRVLYVGDGVASVGHRSAAGLTSEVEEIVSDDPQVTFTAVGIGGDADTVSLSAIARAGGGHYVPYIPGQRVGSAALAVLETTYGVSLNKVELDLPSGIVDVAPRRLPTIRAGEEVLVVGRMTGADIRGEVTLRGKVGGRDFNQRYPVTLTASTAQGNAFVPRQWASGSIDQLQLEGRGEDTSRIIALSKAYGVMSRHTSLLVLESAAMFRAFGVDRAQPSVQWTGEEDMEMGESGGLEVMADGRVDSALSGVLGGLGSRGAGSGAGGFAAGGGRAMPSRRARRSARPGATRAPRPADDMDVMAQPAAEPRPAQQSEAREEERSAPVAEAPPPPTRRRNPGSWMRREWYREGQVNSNTSVSAADTRRAAQAEAALRESPDSRDRHRDLVRALTRTGDLDRAYEVSEQWIERDRLDPEALTYLSDILGRQGKRDRAVRVLSGVVDLKPNDRVLQERLANAFDRAGMPERACAHRVALAEIRRDNADAQGAALRCERSLGRDASARRLLESLPDEEARTRAERAAAELASPRRLRGPIMLDATWSGSADVDLALITPQGTRLSWMGGRTTVVGENASAVGRERLGLRRASAGSYLIEVSRVNPNDTTPISGRINVRALEGRSTVPFVLNADSRAVVGRVTVVRRSRMVQVR